MTSTNGNSEAHDALLDEVVVAYLEAVENGEEPDAREWQARYPELASDLADFFADHASVTHMTAPLRKAAAPDRLPVNDPNSTVEYRPSPLLPTKIGNSGDYVLLEEIARGGMGVVYLARQVSLNRIVAVKMILSGYMASQAEIRRFHDEAIAAAHLDHPNIVPIYEVGEFEGQPFFSMKVLEGGSLSDRLEEMRARPREAAALMVKVSQAVHHAHQRGILHRDLKPGNVLLDRAGEPYVSDFGLSKRIEDGTHSGIVVGTPGYMAPEQAAGTQRPTTSADLYSLGAVLYALLTGRPPFQGENRLEILKQLAELSPISPRALNPLVDRDLEIICLKCLEKSPVDRYSSVGALADDLCRYLAGEPIEARPISLWVRWLKWAKRRPAPAALLLVALATILGMITGYLRYQEHRAATAERALSERRRMDALRIEVEELLRNGQQAMSAARWSDARVHLASARGLMGAETALVDLQAPINRLLEKTDRGLEVEFARRQAVNKYRTFMDLRENALFAGTLFTGANLPANANTIRQTVQEALQLFGVAAVTVNGPVFEPALTAQEKKEITEGCYELLLILAEAAAQGDPHRWQKALAILERAGALGVVSKAYHMQRARYLERLGDQKGARIARERATTLHTSGALDHFLTGEELHRQGKMTEAIAAFRTALRLRPDHFWARYFLAVCYLRLQPARPDLASDSLTACLGQGRSIVWVYLLRGVAHGQLNLFGLAEDDFQDALDQQPSAEARYAVLVNRGILLRRQRKFAPAVADLNQAIALKPKAYQAYANLAKVHFQQQHYDLAVEQIDQGLTAASELFTAGQVERQALASLYRSRAKLQVERKDCRAALDDFGQAIQFDPQADDHVECGRILHAQRSYQEALRAYDTALVVNPDQSEAQLGRAETLSKLEKWREVVSSLDRYLQKRSSAHGSSVLAGVYRARGLAKVKLGQWPDAIADLTMALNHKDDPNTRAHRGWAYLASKASLLALPDFEKAIQLDRNNGDAHNGRGAARVALAVTRSQLCEAVADAETALSHGPKSDSRLLCNAARIYAQAAAKLDEERDLLGSRMRRQYREQVVELLRAARKETPTSERASFRKAIRADSIFLPFADVLNSE
jgi:tetratricopeptide (TPR) repeat protein